MGGFTNPLKDIWAQNTSLLAQNYPLAFESSQGETQPVMGVYECFSKGDRKKNSLLIEDHRAYSAYLYLRDNNPSLNAGTVIDVSHIKGKPTNIRAKIYYDLVCEGYWIPRESPCKVTSVISKINIITPNFFTSPPSPHLLINKHMNRIIKSAPPKVWDFRVKMILRSLPTDIKLREAHFPIKNTLCYFCGGGEDDIKHIFFGCPATKLALSLVSTATRASLLFCPSHILLLSLPTPTTLSATVMVHFLWAVWDQRKYYCGIPERLPTVNIANRISESCFNSLSKLTSPKNISPSLIMMTALSPPRERAIIGFSDGSALDNPGPTGAGAIFSYPKLHLNTVSDSEFSLSLGTGDNNMGEMVAILLLLKLTLHCFTREIDPLPPNFPAFLFSDSLCCISYLSGNWSCPTLKSLARETRSVYYQLTENYPNVRLYWIKAHAGTEGNERADVLAGLGSSTSKTLNSPKAQIILPDPQDPSFIEFAPIMIEIKNRNWS
jgi:ribonuclease HI